ncbi:hypothetical protein [Brevibacillus brevis]|uniref:hypothetical protein n=1 Tax=Brevibacillus brevis TaxID=1393 RepID=UPI000D101546|nr:hypothetical protein [Brevibacillus brevis]PSJ67256.1 hypothetical protein C7J99_21485 [Brevibacillus brevis]RED20943.1 hypothetical protein DES34_1267 [Brevibacillus brevis]GEC93577.1 hypothetical protein BBR01nite_59080 [Brevibacillus brevis]VEF92019.1 Uncharacterised protein [Brevibacillus brevis]
MLAWMEDCILFEYDATDFENVVGELTPSRFEDLSCTKLSTNVFKIEYSWIDPIRMRDKIISRDQKSVTMWIFCSEKIVSCFGNSESAISYAINSLSEKSSIVFKRINTYEYWSRVFNHSNGWFADLISVHVKKSPSAFDEREILNISIKDISEDKLREFFVQDLVTNLTFTYQKTIFHLDLASVISFSDTVKEQEIFQVVNKIAGEFRNYHD